MFEKIRQNATLIAVVLLAWLAYSSLSEEAGDKKAKGKAKLAGIGQTVLVMRDPDVPLDPMRDPIGIIIKEPVPTEPEEERESGSPRQVATTSPRLSKPAITYTPEEHAAAWGGVVRGLVSDAASEVSGWDPFGVKAEREKLEARKALPPARFSLMLDATLGQGGAGLARISGKTVAVGQPIPGLDPRTPPVLESVHGATVIVTYRGDRLVLDLDVRPRIDIGGPPVASASPNTSKAGSGGTGSKKRSGPKPRKKRSGPKPRNGK